MKRVLFIAYHFPPLAGGGTFRSLKFVKYLPEFGWLPTVLTTKTKNYWAYDQTLLNEVPENVKIIRAGELDPFYLHVILSKIGLGKLYKRIKERFLIPDEKIGWIPLAYRKAVLELKKKKYHLIFSTSPTPSAHFIAMRLKQRFKVPWICDIRDFWTTHYTYPYKNTPREKIEQSIESFFYYKSNHLTTVSKGVKSELLKNHNKSKMTVITNGYDQETPLIFSNKSKFKILYTGSFYGHYNPGIFLNALSDIVRHYPNLNKSIDLSFIGNYPENIIKIFRKYTRNININVKSFKSPEELEEEFSSASLLLLILPPEKHYSAYLPAKLFTYIAKALPVLAIIPEGETKEILQKANLGFFADPDSAEDIKNQILHLYHLWKTDQLHVEPNHEYIKQFHRRVLTQKLVNIFNDIYYINKRKNVQ